MELMKYKYIQRKRKMPSITDSLLISRQTIIDELSIAENFNNFLTSTGEKLQNKTYPSGRDYFYYLNNPNPSISTSPTSELLKIVYHIKLKIRLNRSLPLSEL